MLSPDGYSKKSNFAPSIKSLDSGYGTGDALEEDITRRNENGNCAAANRTRVKTEEPAISPLVTKLNDFSTDDTLENANFLPEISNDASKGCFTCELLSMTNPGENTRCEDCRKANMVDPAMLSMNRGFGLKQVEQQPPLQVFASMQQDHQPPFQESSPQQVTRCSACELSTLINPSGSPNCTSCFPYRQPNALSSAFPNPGLEPTVRRPQVGRNSKLPLSALNILQSWLEAHQDNPYPSAEEKRRLASQCGITEKQVTTWFTNARARQLSPLDTWLSASEEEAAKESDIISTAAQTPLTTAAPGFSSLPSNYEAGSSSRRAGSISGSSAFSTPVARTQQPSRRGKKKNYRRNNQLNSPIQSPLEAIDQCPPGDQEMWQCTFCRRYLVPKSWRRHEETQHKPRAEWTCMLTGPRISMAPRSDTSNTASLPTASSTTYCAFCMAPNPSEDHFHTSHRVAECARRDPIERTFYRPDHLRQHVRNFHGAALFDVVQARWKRAPGVERGDSDEGYICGFCGEHLKTWGIRETHIAAHFKEGMTMASWREWPKHGAGEETKKTGKGKGKEKEKEKEQSTSAFKRLSRTLTRKSTRSSEKTVTQPTLEHQQQGQNEVEKTPTPPAQSTQNQYHSGFSNSFQQISRSSAPLSISMPNHQHQTAYANVPPVLPDINMDPLMSPYNDSFVNWSHMCNNTAHDQPYADVGVGMGLCTANTDNMDFDTSFATQIWNPDAMNMEYQDQWGQGN